MRIFFDEAGYTGEDLLNKDQPVFVLASNNFDAKEIEAIWGENFYDIKAQELKYSNLARKTSGQKRIISLINYLNKHFPSKIISVAGHKEYLAICMLVEWLIEPAMHKNGVNLYEKGANIGLANLFFGVLHAIDPPIKTAFLLKFQNLMRNRSKENFDHFWSSANEISRKIPNLQVPFSILTPSQKTLALTDIINFPQHVMEIGLTFAFGSIGFWKSQCQELFEIIHDSSSQMASVQWLWDQITSTDVESRTFPCSGMNFQLPLNVQSTDFGNSKDYRQLQLSDLIAGSTAKWLTSKWKEEKTFYTEELEAAGIQKLLKWIIWPSPNVTPEELETENIDFNEHVEFLSSQIKWLPPKGSPS